MGKRPGGENPGGEDVLRTADKFLAACTAASQPPGVPTVTQLFAHGQFAHSLNVRLGLIIFVGE